jgi:hypothetical protein
MADEEHELFDSDVENFDFEEFYEEDLDTEFEIEDWDIDSDIEEATNSDCETAYRCTSCEKSYKSEGWLIRHIQQKHGRFMALVLRYFTLYIE